ncbi:MAG: tetratricopeptide repeat protein [Fluviicola sp.]
MKTIFFIGLFLLTVGHTFAQPSNVVAAMLSLQEKQLEDAKEKIDAASEHEKTANQAKTWLYRGKIYMAMYSDMNANGKEYGLSAQDLLLEAAASYKKARGMNTERLDVNQMNREYQIIGNYLLNEGVSLYNAKSFEKAATLFKKTTEIQKDFNIVDSLAMYNVALASEKAGKSEEAVQYYLDCARMGYNSEIAYLSAAVIRREQDRSQDAMKIIEEGLAKHPSSTDLMLTKINLLLAEKDFDAALFTIDKALTKLPDNADLHFTRGTLLEGSDINEAMTAYERAIEIDPDHVNALYNLGAAYYNQAVELRNAEGATNLTGIEELKSSRKYLERVEELAPGNEVVQNSLSTIQEILQD